jgi:RNA polymerase sigma-70 factor (ECF subfamily)
MDEQDQGLQAWPDRDLVVAYKGGVPEAYDEMYRRYSARINGVCRRMLNNPEDAREATQETFLKAYQALPRFNGQYKLGAWLARIAANVCVDHIRKRGRGAVMTPLTEKHEATQVADSPEDMLATDDPGMRTLAHIQPLHARALELRMLEGFSHIEIAEQLNMSPVQVKALLHRARLSFKRAWDNASGWALAPLLGLRSLAHQSSKDASNIGAQFPAWSSTAGPVLAERVAASAMVVVVALSGSGATTSRTEAAESPRTPVAIAPFAGAERATGLDARRSHADEHATKPNLVADVKGLLEEVRDTAERKNNDKRNDGKKDDDDDFDPGSADQASQKLVSEVSHTADELQDGLNER